MTLFAALIVTVQVAPDVLVQPDQLVKVEFASGAAVRVTLVPTLNEAEQVVPQLIPAGEEVTVPIPVPVFVIDSVTGG